MGIQMPLHNSNFISFGYVCSHLIAGSYGSPIFNFLETSVLFSIMAILFDIPTNTVQWFPFLHILLCSELACPASPRSLP